MYKYIHLIYKYSTEQNDNHYNDRCDPNEINQGREESIRWGWCFYACECDYSSLRVDRC